MVYILDEILILNRWALRLAVTASQLAFDPTSKYHYLPPPTGEATPP
jgi:hypothetical protein